MPARVHRLAVGRERRARALAQRQAVELRAHRHRRGGAPEAHERDPPGTGGDRRVDRELCRDRAGRPLLGVSQLRVRVEPVAQLDRAR